MKTISTLFLFLLLSLAVTAQTNYPGNGKTGFGGPVGTGSLDISTSGTIITFTLNKGTNDLNDIVVIYLGPAPGGFTTTSGFMDASTGLMKAISGFDGTNRATFNFNNFAPEAALAFGPKNSDGAVLVSLGTATHTVLAVPALTNNGSTSSPNYSVSFDAAMLGLTGSFSFNFLVTYISNTGYRSEEAIGDPMTGFSAQGWIPYTSTTNPLVFNGSFPVILSKFSGVIKGTSAMLNWQTKSESNSKSYGVERSINGNEWKTIGSINATNKAEGAEYNFIDNAINSKTVYYRLQMIDKDGKFKASNAIKLTAGLKNNVILLGNPANNEIKLKISSNENSKYTIELFSMEGRKMSSMNYNHTAGVTNLTMPVSTSLNGFYFIKVTDGEDQVTLPVLLK